jgi:hypothetical protein
MSWNEVPGEGFTLSRPASTIFNSVLNLFVRGTDNRIYRNRTGNFPFGSWLQVEGGGQTFSGPSTIVFNTS